MNEETYQEGDDPVPVEGEQQEESAASTPLTPLRPSTKEVTLDCGILNAEGDNLRDVTISKMKGSDRKDIGERECLNNGGKLVSRLLLNRLDEVKGLNLTKDKDRVIRGMLSADRTRLMLEIYQLTKKRDYLPVTVNCPNTLCKAENEVDFKIIDFPFRPFRNYRLDRQRNLFVFDVEFEVDDVLHKATFRFPNGYDEEATIPLLRRNPVEAGHRMLSRTVLVYDGNKALPRTFIADLDTDELDELSEEFQEHLPGIELSPEMKCFDCHDEATVTVDIADFFFGKSLKAKRK